MKLYETQVQEDLFLTLLPVDASNAHLWNGYYSAHKKPPYVRAESFAHFQAVVEQEKAADPNGRSVTLKKVNSLNQGIVGFEPWEPNKPQDQYVAIASYTRLDPTTHDIETLFEQIEMTMGVYASHTEPLTSHQGISRTFNSLFGRRQHNGLSAYMHAFAATCMLSEYHGTRVPKTHMFNAPTPVMLYLLVRGLVDKGLVQALTVAPRSLYADKPTPDDMATYKGIFDKGVASGSMWGDDLDLMKAITYLVWTYDGPRDPFPDTKLGRALMTFETFISVRLSALQALAALPHPITNRVV